MNPKPIKSSGSTHLQDFVALDSGDFSAFFGSAKAHHAIAETPLNDLFQTDKSAAADEQNSARVHADVFLLRMFASALRRDIANGAFQDF